MNSTELNVGNSTQSRVTPRRGLGLLSADTINEVGALLFAHLAKGGYDAADGRELLARTLCDAILERDLSPAHIDFHGTRLVEEIVAITAPWPLFGRLHQSTFYGVAMHVAQLLDPLFRAPYVEVIKARLPKRPPVLGKKSALTGVTEISPWQQCVRGTLFQHLHDCRGRAGLRLRDQKMNMLGHDNVADHHEAVLLARLLEHREEAVARPW